MALLHRPDPAKEVAQPALLKATIDALDGVLGVRTGTGLRVEADDVRVDRITASKRPAGATEDPGARITVAEL